MKVCSKCKIEKHSDLYNKNRSECRQCQKELKQSKKDQISESGKFYYKNNKEKINSNHREYHKNNKDKINERKKIYQLSKKISEPLKVKIPKIKKGVDKERAKLKQRIRYENNKNKILEQSYVYANNRRKIDPVFKLRKNISIYIRKALKNNNSSKRGYSITNFIPYTIQELKDYLESLFEPWMNWDNHGKYNSKNWNDNDFRTWTWNIDHIIPQSKLPYTNMEEENFRKCWALENLRPLSAKQNLLDSNRRALYI